jgi:AraC-like DNA-binding protein
VNADLAYLAIDIANIVCNVLLVVQVIGAGRNRVNAWLFAAASTCTIAYLILSRADYSTWIAPPYRFEVGAWRPVLNLMRNTTPGLVMILVHRLFVDRRRLPAWALAAFAVQVFLEEPIKWLFPATRNMPWLADVAPTLLQTLFAVAALYWTLAGWRVDLIEARRRGRAVVVVVILVNVLASSLLLRVVIPGQSILNYQTHLVLMVYNLLLAAFLVLRLHGADVDRYLDPARPPAPDARPAGGREGLARVVALMESEHLYREPGLSLRRLADRARLPEYRLRRLIHEELGYRNFNAYLHAYRVREACALLADADQARTPILTIALSVGYQSLNTFNRGFRETTGVTPSAFRADPAAHQIPQTDPNFCNRQPISENGEP